MKLAILITFATCNLQCTQKEGILHVIPQVYAEVDTYISQCTKRVPIFHNVQDGTFISQCTKKRYPSFTRYKRDIMYI